MAGRNTGWENSGEGWPFNAPWKRPSSQLAASWAVEEDMTIELNEDEGKVKSREPDVFDGKEDIRWWIVDMERYFFLSLVKSSKRQAACACSYLEGHLKERVSIMALSGNYTDILDDWTPLKRWLLENYAPMDPEAEAEIKMKALFMRQGQGVREFIGEFETLLLDLEWSEGTTCASFRDRLLPQIVYAIENDYTRDPPRTFADLKRCAQRADVKNSNRVTN